MTLLAANIGVAGPRRRRGRGDADGGRPRREALARADADVVLMAAAVADYRPADAIDGKRPKDGEPWLVELAPTGDIVKALGASRDAGQVLVAFGAEHGEAGLERKRAMLDDKNVDLVVYNDVGRHDIGFDSADNEVVLVTARRRPLVPKAPKDDRRGDPRRGRAAARGALMSATPRDEAPRRDAPPTSPTAWSASLATAVHAPVETLRLPLLCLLAEGHVLVEDVPGGRQDRAREGARAVARPHVRPGAVHAGPPPGGRHRRQRVRPARRAFRFRPGPVFANIVLVDEINRASPKTQSALLEAMQEAQVTVDGATHLLRGRFS